VDRESDQDVFDSTWYATGNGTLYIVGPDEVDGPDDLNASRLARGCREGLDLDEIAEDRGLTRVPDALKRWTPEDGYYTA
jgi:hypothetical protein